MEERTRIATQVRSVCDLLHQYDPMRRQQLKRIEAKGFYNAFARTILAGMNPQIAGHAFSVVNFRSVHGRDLRSVLPVNRRIRLKPKLKTFIGHRFNEAVTPNLRHNLGLIFEAYGIEPLYSDTDSPNGPVFQVILDRIRRCDFSVFDDRETETRPNTLIEVGVAIGLGKPYFYFNYENKRTVQIGRLRERITTASDLAGMLYMPYQEYDLLFRELRFACRGSFAIDAWRSGPDASKVATGDDGGRESAV